MSGVATWVGSPDGRYEAELLDGRLVRLRLPGDLVDPSRSAQLEAELVSLLNEASGRYLDDLLADHEEKDDVRHAAERIAREALAEAARLLGEAEPEPSPAPELPEAEGVGVAWRDGSIAAIRIGHGLLTGGGARLAQAVMDAVNAGPPPEDLEVEADLSQLDPETVRAELQRVVAEYERRGARR